MARRKYIVGNWKMNGRLADLSAIRAIAAEAATLPDVDAALCLPATLITAAAAAAPGFAVGAQDCHMKDKGAHTGCLSAAMLAEAGASLTIIGHSERRTDQFESDSDIRAKALAAQAAGLNVIVCVGESEAERDAGQALSRVLSQVDASLPDEASPQWLAIAYEPIWAIGTGRIPSLDEVAEMHGAIRGALSERFGAAGAEFRILYGGSMNGGNATELLALEDVDGGLVGGASLTAEAFAPILKSAQG